MVMEGEGVWYVCMCVCLVKSICKSNVVRITIHIYVDKVGCMMCKNTLKHKETVKTPPPHTHRH